MNHALILRPSPLPTHWTLGPRDGILQERRDYARRRNLANCGRVCGSPRKLVGSIEEMLQIINNVDCYS